MSNDLVTSTLTIYNYAQYPLACLAVGFYQDTDGAKYTREKPLIHAWEDLHEKTFKNDPLTLDIPTRPRHDCYWALAWNCVYDPAVYYLVQKETFWHKFAEDICKTIDDAIGAGIDIATGSPSGTVFSAAANTAISSIFSVTEGNGKSIIQNKINSDTNEISINLNTDRLSAKLYSGKHHTNAAPHSYLYEDGPNENKGSGLQIANLGN